jgi:hypothetical protein
MKSPPSHVCHSSASFRDHQGSRGNIPRRNASLPISI